MIQRTPSIRLVIDEADAILAILTKRGAQMRVDEADWRRLFESEGYRRLAVREASMNAPISEADFRDFVLSDTLLLQAKALKDCLELYARIDTNAVIERTRAYLPDEATLRGTIYPVIKPKPNSFVFELQTDPAIFLAMKTGTVQEKLANTLVHELHHWGLASCHTNDVDLEHVATDQRPLAFARYALSAFGEGFAMLAAAGGPDVHPHQTSTTEERASWDRSLETFPEDLKRLESFLLEVLDGRYGTEHALFEGAMEFMGVQGPWYTVGWKMAQYVEAHRGREALLECMRDPRRLLRLFNEIAQEKLRDSDSPPAVWSNELLDRLGAA